MPDKIASRIKYRRKELGLSQKALAKACGVGQPTVANWEGGGHTPRQASLTNLAAALRIDEVWLLSGEHRPDRGPLNKYLMRPIRHVAVFDWPSSATALNRASPKTYIAMTTDRENVFGLHLTSDKGPFKAKTILVFSRDVDSQDAGLFLNMSDDTYSLSEHNSDDSQARLVYSLTPH